MAWLFVVLGALALVPYWGQLHDGVNDEAVVLDAAERILSGQIPYKDFDLFYTPGSMLVTALWFKVFGSSLLSSQVLMSLWAGCLTALIFLFSDACLPRRWAVAPPLMFMVAGYTEWPVVSYHWAAITGLLSAVVCFCAWDRQPRPILLGLTGLAVGASAACLQTEGVAVCLTIVALLLARWRDGLRVGVTRLLIFGAGVLVVWAPLVLGLACLKAAPAAFNDTVLSAFRDLYHNHGAPYDLTRVTSMWTQIRSQWPDHWGWPQLMWAGESLALALMLTLKYGFFFPVLAAGFGLGLRAGGGGRVLAVLTVFWLLCAHERLELLYTNYFTPVFYLSLCLLLEAFCGQIRKPRVTAGLAVGLVLFFGFCWVFGLSGYCQQFRYPVDTADGRLWARDRGQAERTQALYAWAYRYTPPGTRAFAWPYACEFIHLSKIVNPTRSDFFTPGWQEPAQIRAAADRLRDSGVEFIYYFALDPRILVDYPAIEPAWFARKTEEMNKVLMADYTLLGQIGEAAVYRRNKTQ